jgi:GT2 family glycosyltransferase
MAARPDAGICGSTLLYYDDPSKVQAWGGSVYNRWVARGGNIGSCASTTPLPNAEEVEKKMGYVIGASMLVRRQFLEEIGLMEEGYFLTFEEIDWATRAKAGLLWHMHPARSSIIARAAPQGLTSSRLPEAA